MVFELDSAGRLFISIAEAVAVGVVGVVGHWLICSFSWEMANSIPDTSNSSRL